jgi:hypothetical protein
MRNYDQVFKYHIQPMLRLWPELEAGYRKGDKNLRLPNGSQIDFSYAEDLLEIERRFRSANYYDIFVDQAEQFVESELREMKKANRWPGTVGKCKAVLFFNMGGAGIQTLRKWFHTHEYNEREDSSNFAFVHVFPWDNVEWSRAALEADGYTQEDYYYEWSDVERQEYCAQHSDYGKALNSEDDAIRNRDWLGSWESLEGAYFGRVFDQPSTLVTNAQVQQLIKPWDVRWLSQDWGKAHYCVTHWHAKALVPPEQARAVLGWVVNHPLNVAITYREMIVNEMSSPEVARAIVEHTPEHERKQMRAYFLSPDAFGERDSANTTAMNQGAVLRAAGLPEPVPADNDRPGGARLMYDLLAETKRHGSKDGNVWVISAECPKTLETIPLLMRDSKNLDDVLKTDKGGTKLEQDLYDSARYGLQSMLRAKTTVPVAVRAQAVLDRAPDNTQKHLAMLEFKDREARQKRAKGGTSWR